MGGALRARTFPFVENNSCVVALFVKISFSTISSPPLSQDFAELKTKFANVRVSAKFREICLLTPFEHLRGACACAPGAYCLRPAHGDLVYPCTQQMYSLGRWHGPQGAEKPTS